jgi:cytochrome P450
MHPHRSTSAKCYAAEEAYVDPESFIPERWSTKPELVKDRNAFFPFSLGMSGLSL